MSCSFFICYTLIHAVYTLPCSNPPESEDQAELLRLAIARARRAGVELQQAEQLLQDEREASPTFSNHPYRWYTTFWHRMAYQQPQAFQYISIYPKADFHSWHVEIRSTHFPTLLWEVEQALEQLRRASAARDVRALRRAIADCADAAWSRVMCFLISIYCLSSIWPLVVSSDCLRKS